MLTDREKELRAIVEQHLSFVASPAKRRVTAEAIVIDILSATGTRGFVNFIDRLDNEA
jgi:hypothetical protein